VIKCKTNGSRTEKRAKGTGVLIFVDSIAEKPDSDHNEFICYHWDHSTKRYIK
jgi:hypothetical protein